MNSFGFSQQILFCLFPSTIFARHPSFIIHSTFKPRRGGKNCLILSFLPFFSVCLVSFHTLTHTDTQNKKQNFVGKKNKKMKTCKLKLCLYSNNSCFFRFFLFPSSYSCILFSIYCDSYFFHIKIHIGKKKSPKQHLKGAREEMVDANRQVDDSRNILVLVSLSRSLNKRHRIACVTML